MYDKVFYTLLSVALNTSEAQTYYIVAYSPVWKMKSSALSQVR